MKLERRCLVRGLITMWCISVSESESEDESSDMSDDQRDKPSVSLNLEPHVETIGQSGTEERPNDGAADPSTDEKDDSDSNKEIKPLLRRDSASEWVAEEIFHKTKPSIDQLAKGVYGQTLIDTEDAPVAGESLFPIKGKQKYLAEDFIWQSVSGHPYILPLYAKFYNSNKFSYNFISQYLPMVNLRKFMKTHKVLQTKVCRVLTSQIASAICFIHNKDIFHRDVNSKNILICSDGKAKLSNFKHSVNNRTSRGLHGHFFYQAPEVLSGGIYDTTADWFSLGVCLYEMVMNHTPIENHCMRYNIKFDKTDFYGKVVVLLNCTYYIPKVFPEDLKMALEDFLNKDPTKRLGYKDNLEDFKNHPFFTNIEWNELDNGSLTAILPNKEEIRTKNKIKASPEQTKYKF